MPLSGFKTALASSCSHSIQDEIFCNEGIGSMVRPIGWMSNPCETPEKVSYFHRKGR